MADIQDTALAGGGGVFVASDIAGSKQIAAGSSGTLFSITPPAGERVVIESMWVLANQTDLTLSVGGTDVISGQTLVNINVAIDVADGFRVINSGNGAGRGSAGLYPIYGGIDEVVSLSLDTGTTGTIIYYSYAYGTLR